MQLIPHTTTETTTATRLPRLFKALILITFLLWPTSANPQMNMSLEIPNGISVKDHQKSVWLLRNQYPMSFL